MPYVTRVSVWFYSEGKPPSVVIKKLKELGFVPVRGAYDFVYTHAESISETDLDAAIIWIADALHKTLSGFKVLYNIETRPADEEKDYVPLSVIDDELERTRIELLEAEREKEPPT